MTRSKERRKDARYLLKMPVDCQCKETFLIESASNISRSGIFIDSNSPEPIGTEIVLQFKDPRSNEDSQLIQATGRVVWINQSVESKGMGLEFTDIAEEHLDVLMHWVKRIAVLD